MPNYFQQAGPAPRFGVQPVATHVQRTWSGPFYVWDDAEDVYQHVWTLSGDLVGQYTSAKRINSKFPKAVAQYDLWVRRQAPTPTNAVFPSQWTMICRETENLRGWSQCPRGFPYPPVQPVQSYYPPPAGPSFPRASGQVGQGSALTIPRYTLLPPKPPLPPCPPGYTWCPPAHQKSSNPVSWSPFDYYWPGGCCPTVPSEYGNSFSFSCTPGSQLDGKCVPPINVPPVYNPCQPGWNYNAAAKKCCPPGWHYDPYVEQCVKDGSPKGY